MSSRGAVRRSILLHATVRPVRQRKLLKGLDTIDTTAHSRPRVRAGLVGTCLEGRHFRRGVAVRLLGPRNGRQDVLPPVILFVHGARTLLHAAHAHVSEDGRWGAGVRNRTQHPPQAMPHAILARWATAVWERGAHAPGGKNCIDRCCNAPRHPHRRTGRSWPFSPAQLSLLINTPTRWSSVEKERRGKERFFFQGNPKVRGETEAFESCADGNAA